MKKRIEIASNYSAIFHNGKTLRIPLNPQLEIKELINPEFYDISLGTYCKGGCPYCYASASTRGNNYKNVSEKIKDFFQKIPLEDRPFQVAIGGGGEPTLHPEFEKVLKTFSELDIVPNYTTNGMHLDENLIKITKRYCGGVALTLHPHLKKYWEKGLKLLTDNNIKTNVHLVIWDKKTIDTLNDYYNKYFNIVEYFVLLPRMNVGFAKKNPHEIDYKYLKNWLDNNYQNSNIAFGANFYNFLKNPENNKYNVALYPPEIMSKYMVLEDKIKIYNNSFECKLIKEIN